MPHGLLNLNKPATMTSRRAVDIVQRLVRPLKAGHAGTLDPLATGVLVVCVGAATRLISYVQRMPKRYTGVFRLGQSSPTEDIEGEIVELVDPPVPTLDQLVVAARALTGQLEQRPPVFSAVKVNGRRAYDLARKGRKVELSPRPITVYSLDVVHYEYPELVLDIECSAGTYVRSLGRDLAESLGTAAVMIALTRTAVGDFTLSNAIDSENLTMENLASHIEPISRAVTMLPQVVVGKEEIVNIRNGLDILRPATTPQAEEFAAMDDAGCFVAILGPRGDDRLRPLRNLPPDAM